MRVYGIEIKQEDDQAAVEMMRLFEDFEYYDVQLVLCLRGYSEKVAYRAADRILQRERKAGNIAQAKRCVWYWVKG